MNAAAGYGVEGSARANDGVVGHTANNADSPAHGKAGVAGYDDSTNHTPSNSGVYGISMYAMGVQGRSTYGPGLLATSYKSNAISAIAGSTSYTGFTNVGVVAQSTAGDGMIAVGTITGIAAFATGGCSVTFCATPLQDEIPSGAAVTAGTDVDGLGLKIVTDANQFLMPTFPDGVGATIDAGSIGMMITPDRSSRGATGLIVNGSLYPRDLSEPSFQGAIVTGYDALSVTARDIGIAVTGAQAIVAQGVDVAGGAYLFTGQSSSGTTTSLLDDLGNLSINGTLTERGTIVSQLRNPDGTYSASYSAHTTVPTVEDVGEANLVSGVGSVKLDSALRKSVDLSHGYLVFLTPQGPTSGLYVTAKTTTSFGVREIGGARDSLAFDYRIVAYPYAAQGLRLAPTTSALRSPVQGRPLFYRHIKPLRFAHGEVMKTSLPSPSM